jgi:hypothetical protein
VDSAAASISGVLLQRKCACGGSSGLTGSCFDCEKNKLLGQPLQTKLRINEPGDEYEQEADRVAAQVMRMTDSDFNPSPLQSSEAVQRRFAGDEHAHINASVIQREEVGAEPAGADSVPLKENATPQDEGNTCPQPEDMSRQAAEHYMQNDMNPPSQATVDKIDCESPNPDGVYGCYVHLSDGVITRVIVRKKDIVVGVAPLNTLTPPPATPLCFYNYQCLDGQLVLIKRKCKSATPRGPIIIAQRSATPSGTGSIQAARLVNDILGSPGQPLDRATRQFFAARFGHDFANVRVHADAEAAESARSVNALAFTVGHHLVFGAGQYAPGRQTGQRLLAHELTHVLQQSGADSVLTGAFIPGRETVSGLASMPALVQREPAESGGSCSDTVFCTYLNLPLLMKDRYFIDGEETDESSHNARVARESSAGKCNINLTQELGVNLGPLNPSVAVNFFYRGEPCCRCFRGNLSWNVTVNGNLQTGIQGVRAGGECAPEKCCDVKKSLPVSITVSLGAKFNVVGTIQLDGSTYKSSS